MAKPTSLKVGYQAMSFVGDQLDRRDFLVLSGGAAALVAVSVACGVDVRKKKKADEEEPAVELLETSFPMASSCRCPECIRREMIGAWHLPDESSAYWDHLHVYYECRRKHLP